ncbi:30S ribosomal protein S3 [Candidatus Uhrbacteria bacterium]|nr:30S ribosomal protein S3 [Candidatus Uhrbacteria bacterium]
MGHKVNPKIFRTGVLYGWDSKWFASGKQFRDNLANDICLRKYLEKQLKGASVSKIEIERTTHVITITIHSGKPGVIIGRQGAGIEELKKKIRKEFFGSEKVTVNVNVVEVDRPTLDAQLVAQGMIEELEKRMPYRRVMKQAIDRVSKGGAQGVKVRVSGRLNGAEIANVETLHNGKIPLHTLRAHIDYARGAARTLSGAVGVKVWIYKGMNFGEKEK